MRLLHTSDWHLGRSLHRADLRAAQSAFLDHLVEVARAERVDAVLVAGDVYDRAVPAPSSSTSQLPLRCAASENEYGSGDPL